jgi:peptidoglycan/xylan/chitin deacetylase (PgdA/CDA1 family)
VATLFINYHRMALNPQKEDVYVLTFDEFSHQIDLMQSAGVVITPAADAFIESKKRQVAITFDDGYKSDLTSAELLARKKLSAMFFISTANIGANNYLDEDDIRELHKIGMVVGSHSHEHIRLNTMSLADAQCQMTQSKQRLEEIIKQPIHEIAFPGGGYNKNIVRLATSIGYRYQLTTNWGINSFAEPASCFLVKRNNIMTRMAAQDFLALVTFQSLYKRQIAFLIKQATRALLPETLFNQLRRALK